MNRDDLEAALEDQITGIGPAKAESVLDVLEEAGAFESDVSEENVEGALDELAQALDALDGINATSASDASRRDNTAERLKNAKVLLDQA